MYSHRLAKLLMSLPDAEIRIFDTDCGGWDLTVKDAKITDTLGHYSDEISNSETTECKYIKLYYDYD